MLVPAAGPFAAEAPAGCPGRAQVVGTGDGASLRLDRPVEDTDTVRLAGIIVADDAALAAGARSALERLTRDTGVCVAPLSPPLDRYGQLQALVLVEGGPSLQAALLHDGLARVVPKAEARSILTPLLAAEREARDAGRGIWQLPAYHVRHPDEAKRDIGSFQIVEGQVREVARRQSWWYLNFGDDWRSDFTVTIPTAAVPAFEQAGIAPRALSDRRLRVRGWLRSFNGPMIEATIPEQIEVLDGGAG